MVDVAVHVRHDVVFGTETLRAEGARPGSGGAVALALGPRVAPRPAPGGRLLGRRMVPRGPPPRGVGMAAVRGVSGVSGVTVGGVTDGRVEELASPLVRIHSSPRPRSLAGAGEACDVRAALRRGSRGRCGR